MTLTTIYFCGVALLLLVSFNPASCQMQHDNHGMTGMVTQSASGMDGGKKGSDVSHDGHDMSPEGTADNGDDTMDHSSGHESYFNFGLVTVLFKEWRLKNDRELAGACVGIAILAVIYEGIKTFREYLMKRANNKALYNSFNCSVEVVMFHIVQTVFHMIQVLISYFLMLVFMTFNVWLCISVILGSGLGYLLFAWKRTTTYDANAHCE